MFSFSGSSRPRPIINLGGQSSTGSTQNPSEIMRKAKEDRLLRERFKRQQAAVLSIQAFWRSRTAASQTRISLRNQFDQLIAFDFPLAPTNPIQLSSSLQLSPIHHLHLFRLILVFYTPSNQADQSRLAKWAILLILHHSAPHLEYARRDDDLGRSWRGAVVPLMIRRMLHTVAKFPRSEYCSTFLSAVKQMMNDIKARTDLHALAIVGRDWYWNCLKQHILSFEIDEKTASQTISLAIELSVSPFNAISSTSLSLDQRANLLVSFVAQIFTIPVLPNRIDIQTLVHFSVALPFEEMVHLIGLVVQRLDLPEIIHLLSNLLVWGSKKISSISSEGYEGYLNSIQLCLDRLPSTLFINVDLHLEKKKNHKANSYHQSGLKKLQSSPLHSGPSRFPDDYDGMAILEGPTRNTDEDVEMSEPIRTDSSPITKMLNSLSPKTLQWLSTLTSPDHLLQLYTVSNKYSATSRPQFCRLMVSIIYAWPTSRKKVLNTLIFSPISTRAGANSGSNNGGLMRELWRSSVRSGKVGISLRDRKSGGSPQGVLTTLNDQRMTGQWEDLIILSELYSRCLMTLGDDEFFNDETEVSSLSTHRPNAAVLSAGRNPLMLDEVIGLAGLLRNLAFGLYWTEGQADIKQGYVVGTNVSFEQLRTLATRLLQQIYIRDSRRPFCEPGFWWMTSTFDLRSFIQTVVYEESHLEEVRDHQPQLPSHLETTDPDIDILEHLPSSLAGHSRARVSKRQLAFISPRLGVLNNIPFVIPFDQRVTIFRTFVESDRHRLGLGLRPFREHRHKASIRREHVSEDGFLHFSALGPRLKETVEIKFIDQHGLEEAGIDGGGVFKEFLTSLTKEIFDANKGLWLVNKNQELYPNPHSYSKEPLSLEWYSFLGRVLGKALYEGILIDVDFADFFLNKWLGKQSYLDDLASLDPELYQGLLFLKHYKGDVEADLSLNFTVTVNEFDKSETIELIPNGAKRSVTAQNRINYIYLVSNYKLNVQLEAQCAAFFRGLNDIIELKWLRMFNQVEMKVLVGGLDGQDLDIDDLQQWTVYGGWDESHDTIRIFWRVVKGFDNLTKRKLLKFVTSCSRPPLLGFKELKPSFAIRAAGTDGSRLPSASTCVNLLKLPEYESEELLREKLVYAINAGAGFDLS